MLKAVPQAGLNHLLFRCDNEENDITMSGRAPYGLQGYGQFSYAGVTSIMHIIE